MTSPQNSVEIACLDYCIVVPVNRQTWGSKSLHNSPSLISGVWDQELEMAGSGVAPTRLVLSFRRPAAWGLQGANDTGTKMTTVFVLRRWRVLVAAERS